MANRQLLQDIQRRQRQLRLESINPDKVAEVMRIKESYVKYENLQSFEKAVTSILADMKSEIELIKSRAETLVENAKDRIEETLDEVKDTTEKQVDKSVGSILDDRMDSVREDVDKSIRKVKDDVSYLLENTESKLLKELSKVKELDKDVIGSINQSIKKLSDNLNSIKGSSKQQVTKAKEDISGSILDIQKSFEDRIKSLENDLFNSIDDIETLKRQPAGSIPKGLIEKINSFVVQRSVSIPVTIDQGGTGATTAAQARTNLGITSGGVVETIVAGVGISIDSTDPANPIVTNTIAAGTGITRTIVITSGSVTAGATAATDYVYLVAGAHTITMPTAVSNTNRYSIKNNHSANITVNTTSSQTIDGTTTISLAPEESVDIISTDTNWSII